MTQPPITRVLGALAHGMDTVTGLTVALQLPRHEVLDALQALVLSGFVVHPDDDDESGWRLTPAGTDAARAGLQVTEGGFGRRSSFSFVSVRSSRRGPVEPDWEEIGGLVGQVWSTAREVRHAERESREQALLVGDAERDSALGLLAHAFGEGRLSQEEHDRRTDLALRAETRADLDRAAAGLLDAAAEPPVRGRHLGLWAVGLLALPVIVVALLIAGSDAEDAPTRLLAGLVLVVVLPGLLGLAWWANAHRAPGHHWRPGRRLS